MSGFSSFNSLLEEFINEVQECFPDENKIKVYKNSFELLKKTNPKKCMVAFMNAIEPYKERINQEDESLMLDESITLVNELNLCGIWKHENCTENTKQAIWSHLKTLIIFGDTLQVIPSGLMSGIEKLASEYADQMDGTDVGSIDPTMLMKNMQKMLSKS